MASINFSAFNLLPLDAQIVLVVQKGTFLATRLGDKGDTVNLYYLGTFFAELYYEPLLNVVFNCRTFASRGPLEAYMNLIDLPNI